MSASSKQLHRDLEAIGAKSAEAQSAAIEAEDTLTVIEDREARRALRSVGTVGGNRA